MADEVLCAHELVAGYLPGVDIVRGLDLAVRQGEMVAVVGPNGAGKSTLVKCLCGLVRARRGQILLDGVEITRAAPHDIARRGVGYVPQRDNIFPRLTVEENLELGTMVFREIDFAQERAHAFALFPRLAERRRQPAGVLSGGERQMLALARAVIARPRVLLLDEPSAGVDTRMADVLWEKIAEVHAEGSTILIVEQNARRALAMCDRGYVLDLGVVAHHGAGGELVDDPAIAELYLGGRPQGARPVSGTEDGDPPHAGGGRPPRSEVT